MVEIKMIWCTVIKPRVPTDLSEDWQLRFFTRSDAPQAATSPPNLDRWSRWDRMIQITPRHLRTINKSKNWFLIRKIDF